nr:hypothetical protein [Cereibacter changlensis]
MGRVEMASAIDRIVLGEVADMPFQARQLLSQRRPRAEHGFG